MAAAGDGRAAHARFAWPQMEVSDDARASLAAAITRIAELEAQLRALQDGAVRSQLVLDSAIDYAIITLDLAGCITGWNAGAEAIMGYTEAEMLGRSGEAVFTAEDRANGRFNRELQRALQHGRAINERWHLRRDGNRFWASGTMMPLRDQSGTPWSFLNILRDRTEVRAAVERRELLAAEMSHRVRNTFATVQAVAALTGRHTDTPAAFQTAFGARLAALGRSHDVMVRGGWDETSLCDVIQEVLAPFAGKPGCVTLEGVPVLLAANLVATVSLAFHELATNAVKHGALSVPGGTIRVAWTVSLPERDERQVELIWQERGGPPVHPPSCRGFGSQLLECGMVQGATVRSEFQPRGLECRITLPLVRDPPGTPMSDASIQAPHPRRLRQSAP
jgi:PAS domain S-box-containing protein